MLQEIEFLTQYNELLVLSLWLVLTSAMYKKGFFHLAFCRLSMVSVVSLVGYICLIIFGILGAGFKKGLLFQNFDAFIEPF